MTSAFVAVHGGAGVHDRSLDSAVKKALHRACTRSLEILIKGRSALLAVEEAVSVLEDDPHLNAGYGSNLSLDGKVECDAAIMDGKNLDFGSVGAVAGVKNPIRLARSVLEHSLKKDPLGRIPPLTLVSEGARVFAASSHLELVPPQLMVSPKAREDWYKWKEHLEKAEHGETQEDAAMRADLDSKQDTVGAVAWDRNSAMAAGVSSGGLLLKYAGRIGEAASFGAGCWANREMACSISGAGELIVRSSMARSLSEALRSSSSDDTHEILRKVLIDDFWETCRERGELEPNAGILLLTSESDGEGEVVPRLWCAFTTESMAVAYISIKNPRPKTLIIRRPKTSSTGKPPFYITSLPI